MNKQHDDYKVVPYTKLRRLLAVMLRALQRKPMMHFLLEVDVTRAREYIREYKTNTGETLSFTAFLIACLAQAVDEHKNVQAFVALLGCPVLLTNQMRACPGSPLFAQIPESIGEPS